MKGGPGDEQMRKLVRQSLDQRSDRRVCRGSWVVQPQSVIPVQEGGFSCVFVVSIAEEEGGNVAGTQPQFPDCLAQMVDSRRVRMGGEDANIRFLEVAPEETGDVATGLPGRQGRLGFWYSLECCCRAFGSPSGTQDLSCPAAPGSTSTFTGSPGTS